MIRLLSGDCRDVLATLPAESVQCVVDNVIPFRYNAGMNDIPIDLRALHAAIEQATRWVEAD